jgi:hypothetical protein
VEGWGGGSTRQGVGPGVALEGKIDPTVAMQNTQEHNEEQIVACIFSRNIA